MNNEKKAICWQLSARDFYIIQDAYRRQHDIVKATVAQRQAAIAADHAMAYVGALSQTWDEWADGKELRHFNAETIAECERIQQEIDQADYDLSRQHRGFGSV